MAHEAATQPTPAEPLVLESKSGDKKRISAQEIVESLKSVGEEFGQINDLISEEGLLVAQFFESLQKHMKPLAPSIAVSTSLLPIEIGEVAKARMHPTGHLVLTLKEEHMKVEDLSENKNRDLLVTVVDDAMPKIRNLTSQSPDEYQEPLPAQEPPQVHEIPAPPPPPPSPPIKVDTPVSLPELEGQSVQEEVSILSAEERAKIAEIVAATVGNLGELGGQVFEHSPISMYFDDWMANLRQVILEFESNGAISTDGAFTKECMQIFSIIEGELAKRRQSEAEVEASTKTLAENKNRLGEMDAEYAAQTRDIVVKGKSAIDYLTKNVSALEAELAKLEQIKTSYLHPLKKMAKEQKQTEVTQKLNAAKRKLALSVQQSAVKEEKLGKIDAEYAAQTRELAAKRKSVIDLLTKNVRDVERELVKIKQIKTSYLNPLKKMAKEQKEKEFMQKLNAAKRRLALAKQNSGAEQEKLNKEYAKKKQATIVTMHSLEKEIANKEADSSLEARQAATNALSNAVNSLVQRKTTPPK